MGKKTARKVTRSQKTSPYKTAIILRYLIIGFGCLLLALAGKTLLSGITTIHVLGASTGPVLLADHGNDERSGGGGDSNVSGGSSGGSTSNDSTSGSLGSRSSNTLGSDPEQAAPATNPSMSGSTTVDCVGPDGKHFTTEYHDCQELNQKWGNIHFTFTPLSRSQSGEINTELQPTEAPDPTRESHKTLDIETKDHQGTFTVTQSATLHVQAENGHIAVKAQEENGQITNLDEKDALEQINNSLKSDGVEVSPSAHSMVVLKKAGVTAETAFPLSVDPIRHVLTITTPSGVKEVTVLPDQAVMSLLQTKLMTNIASQGSTDSAEATQTTTLTELNNNAVFEVNGIAQKKLLGIFPVGFAKTAFVSATTGQVMKINETGLNQFLELFSF